MSPPVIDLSIPPPPSLESLQSPHAQHLLTLLPSSNGIECTLCSSSFPPASGAFCDANCFTCLPCLNGYILLTPRSVNVASLVKPCHSCKSTIRVTKEIIGHLKLKQLEDSITEINSRVATGIKMNCSTCSKIVGVVDSTETRPQLPCPNCSTAICCKCGLVHSGLCLSIKRKLSKNSKICPNCSLGIEKMEGCNHVKCPVEFGGCGFDFCWLCSGEWPDCGCGEANKRSEELAREMEREEMRGWGGLIRMVGVGIFTGIWGGWGGMGGENLRDGGDD
ncbi:hypothetical protein TL16_g07577 [Triparma laevis f. inornata]|uniref:RING-type domain-containing protein n=1 Tax=Triparma laevis f. inornata TaxID=1714386 RepID=A0A9W7AXR2_9STRA|nr:hypothetical protein TL16_g07577 [Triparma laevis f. inornata]